MYNNFFGFREPPFNVTPDPHFLWVNPTYMEAFATLQYGIEEKKGFVLITGEVGTGKTTLLRKLMRTMGSTIHSVFIFNTYLTFTELLRLILRDLGLPAKSEDRITMIEELNAFLIEQLTRGHIVCVLIDEAQNLSDDALEGIRLLSNLETDKEKLIQIVLMGQPELKERLDRPQLRQLKQRVVLECRLAPLTNEEVRAYIDFRLHAAGYEGAELFRSDAVERITLYSRGIPRLINGICDNALLTAYAASEKTVTRQMIEESAHDLRLGKRAKREVPPAGSETANRQASDFRVKEDRAWDTDTGDIPLEYEPRFVRRGRTGLSRAGMTLLLILAVAGIGGAVFYPSDAEYYFATLRRNVADLVGVAAGNNPKAENPVAVPREELASLQEPQKSTETEASMPDRDETDAPLPDRDQRLRPNVSKAAKESTKSRARPARSPAFDNRESQSKKTELQIVKAIQNRAIDGVQVSVVEGKAFLDGRVATERQKSAAEQATRSVPGVKEVQSRIEVNQELGIGN
jgi:general secretion pathway protein A